ncbi:hypothetical protein C8F01DRAFT_1172718 [Mycena amicta]|nr:hypothetical protein C8F01DRAFT_1172718 [Mycena amicta]
MDTTTIDIIDAILSHLADGSPTVRACRLVCRTWHSASCYYHSKTTTLLVSGDQVSVFLGLLRSPNCTIHRWLRGITVAAIENGPMDVLPALLPRFSALQRLRIIGTTSNSPQICEMPVLPGITALHIESIRMRSFSCFTNFLAKLPNLKKLTKRRVWYQYKALPPLPASRPSDSSYSENHEESQTNSPGVCPACLYVAPIQRLSLDTFQLDLTSVGPNNYRDARLLYWLSAEATAPIVSHITVYPKGMEPRGNIQFMRYLNHIGERLQSFHLVSHYNAQLQNITFNGYRALATLRITFYDAFHYRELFLPGAFQALLTRAISQCRTLNTLVFDVPANSSMFGDISGDELDRLGDTLRSALQVKRIRFNVHCRGHLVDVEGKLAEGHFDWNDGEDSRCEAGSVFRAQVVDRLGLRLEHPEICTMQLSDAPVEVEI